MDKDDLKLKFQYIENGDNVYKINTDSEEYRVFIVKDNGWYGIGLEVDLSTAEYFEKFESVVITTKLKVYNSSTLKLLEIITEKKELYNEFSIICCEFLDYISNESNRKEFIKNPRTWLDKWKDLLGNTLKTEENYSFLAELLSINYLLNYNREVVYSDYGTHDIETENDSYEIKSTISRYGYDIHINGQHQLERANKNLNIIFIRMEKSLEGISINDIVAELMNKEFIGIDYIEKKIKNISTYSLNEKYKVLESRLYKVDDNFPKIIQSSFKDEMIPDSIKQINYIVDLSGINCVNIDIDK